MDLVTVTGSVVKCRGIWHHDRNDGKQFKADFLPEAFPFINKEHL